MTQLIEQAIQFNQDLYLYFIDLEKVFDRIQLKDVLQMLWKSDPKQNYINTTVKVTSHEGMFNLITVESGITQGDSLSPILIKLILDEIIREN